MPYFDLHCHPFLRSLWITDRQPDTEFLVQIDPQNIKGVKKAVLNAFAKPLGAILNSQSCLNHVHQADSSGAKIIVATVFAMENSYANLKLCGFKNVLQFVKGINRGQLEEIGNAVHPGRISYHVLVKRELDVIKHFEPMTFGGFRYKVVNDFAEVDLDPNVINVVMNMEGGHNFYTMANIHEQEKEPNRGKVTKALADWKQAAFKGDVPRLFYITLTHHTTNCLTNHAFGVPSRFAGDGTNPDAGGFNPGGNRITDEGLNFIRTALRQTDNEERTLIDLKHMSVQARRQWYKFRERLMQVDGFAPIPLVASHMGVTGLSWLAPTVAACHNALPDPDCFTVDHDDTVGRLGFRLRTEGSTDFRLKFNPWSINLYDEEIELIVKSKGLIGLLFDDRVLGNSPATETVERFSRREMNPTEPDPGDRFPLPCIASIDFNHPEGGDPEVHNVRFPHQNRPHPGLFKPNYPDGAIMPASVPTDFIQKSMGLLSLCQNIIHIVRRGGPDAWNRICIGSDFDGIMDSIDAVPNAKATATMREPFTNFISLMIRELNKHITLENLGIPDPAKRETLLAQPPTDFYDKFIFDNARAFLDEHFRRRVVPVVSPELPL